jgi:transposase InsO family protein
MCVAQCHRPPLVGIQSLDRESFDKRKIKILRSDNGGEYTSKEFVNFCKDVGIKRELTTSYNPQQNGVAE